MQELVGGQDQPDKRKHGAQVELTMTFTSRPLTDTEAFFAACAVLFPVVRAAAAVAGVSLMIPSPNERVGSGRAYKEAPGRYRATTYVTFSSEQEDWEDASAWLRTALAHMSHPTVRVDAVTEARVGA